MNKIEKVQFIKPSLPLSGKAILNLNRVISNKLKGIETTLILDTNVLIKMERVVKNGNKASSIKSLGLKNLVDFLRRCPPQAICLSPGQALYEMPPAAAERSRVMFDAFCAVHLPGFIDTPNSIRKTFEGPEASYGFFDLPSDVQSVYALTFTSLLLLQLVDRSPIKEPIDKFKEYLRRLVVELDLLSAKEIEIAKYCFVEPPAKSRGLIDFRREVRRNFLQKKDRSLPTNAEESFSVAFNATRDLFLLHSANISDTQGLDGVPQDTWIATHDKKLAAFAEVVHNVNVDGDAGKYSAVVRHPESNDDIYWLRADTEHYALAMKRSTYHKQQKMDLQKFVQAAYRIAEEIRSQMPS